MFKKLKEKYELDKAGVEISDLTKQVTSMQKDNEDLAGKITLLTQETDRIREAAKQIIQERDKLKTMVRDQTEADLLFNALQAVGIIPKAKTADYFARDASLRTLQQQAMAIGAPGQQMSAPWSSLLGGIGQYCR